MTQNIINTIKTSKDDIVLFGASGVLTQLFDKISKLGIKVSHICDNDQNKQGQEMFGFVIQNPEKLFSEEKKYNVIITSSFFIEIEQQLKEYSNVITYLDYKKLYDLVNTTVYTPKLSLLEHYEELRDDYNCFVRNLQKDTNPIVISRYNFSQPYLQGKGLEIGAFHLPTPVDENLQVDYVDQVTMAEIKERFPEFTNTYCVYPTIIDDGEVLSKIPDEKYEFVIANHMLEHCQNFFATINNHLRVLKKNGLLFYSLPDKRVTFDKPRELTTYEHLKHEFLFGTDRETQYEHYYDFLTNVSQLRGDELNAALEKYMRLSLDTHFHVWDSVTLLEHLKSAIEDKLIDVEIVVYKQVLDIEAMVILRKR
ncbi:MAG: methyltransferase domain-containing protein [Campylobacterales bacterium]|nr:methyltransferase domain-containing protein [Campylobacterales bacterium]